MPYVKLDCGIVQSTIWLEDAETVRVWIYLLTQADAVGCVRSTVPAIARDNLMGIERVREILLKFSNPDPDSRDPGNSGKRIEIHREPEWEIEILNYLKYREKDFTNAERQRAFRERQRAKHNAVMRNEKLRRNGNVTLPVTQAEAEAKETKKTLCPKFTEDSEPYRLAWLLYCLSTLETRKPENPTCRHGRRTWTGFFASIKDPPT